MSQRQRRYNAQTGRRLIQSITNLEAITIARVQGHAIGGGFGLMNACDLRVVMQDARLYLPEVDINVPLTWGLTAMLARDVGMAKAKELIMLCDDMPVEEALSLGLINRMSAAGDEAALDEAVDDFAYRLAAKNPGALHMAKTQFRSLQHNVSTGDTTEHDGDLLLMQGLMPGKARL
jgi:enoyl-CoA hydratase/carnithine racemase